MMIAGVIIAVGVVVLIVSYFWETMPGRTVFIAGGIGIMMGGIAVGSVLYDNEDDSEIRASVEQLGFTVHSIDVGADTVRLEVVDGCVHEFSVIADPEGGYAVVLGSESLVEAVPVFDGDGYAHLGNMEDCPEQPFNGTPEAENTPPPEEE